MELEINSNLKMHLNYNEYNSTNTIQLMQFNQFIESPILEKNFQQIK